jgi:hypothetical protein
MKNSLLIALLGLTVTMAVPTAAVADNDHKQWRSNKHANKHNDNNRQFARPKPPKAAINHDRRHDNHGKRHENRHNNNVVKHHPKKHHKNYRRHEPRTSFSITIGNDFPSLVFGNDYPNPKRHVYREKHHYGPAIYQRLDKQARRIQRGINKGQLVHREVRKLRREQRYIRDEMAYFKRDGRLNRHERSRLNRMLDVADNNIRNKRHNRLTRDSRHREHNYDYAWY